MKVLQQIFLFLLTLPVLLAASSRARTRAPRPPGLGSGRRRHSSGEPPDQQGYIYVVMLLYINITLQGAKRGIVKNSPRRRGNWKKVNLSWECEKSIKADSMHICLHRIHTAPTTAGRCSEWGQPIFIYIW